MMIFILKEASTTTTPQSLSSSPSPSSSETNKLSEKPAAASGLQLYVGLTLVAKIILLSTPLVIFCKKRRVTKTKGEDTQNTKNSCVVLPLKTTFIPKLF
ncbi:hypothetical protein XENORESO_020611 [Xenotaenia resolanae]|uniref:Uncharacterized protein n=1 Tax=Xenotaenia resolanae TaxID=208358 RepID=A0ABV0WS76_9TELE